MFDGVDGALAQALFGIPGVKGVEFGAGFAAAEMKGSENNDAFAVRDGRVVTLANNHGGVLGGMTSGMPLVFRVALKPTPSIYKEQRSVDLREMKEVPLVVRGRHGLGGNGIPRGLGKDLSLAVPCVGRLPQAERTAVDLAPALKQIGRKLGRLPQKQKQNARRERIKRARMADLLLTEALYLREAAGRCRPRGLVKHEHAVQLRQNGQTHSLFSSI